MRAPRCASCAGERLRADDARRDHPVERPGRLAREHPPGDRRLAAGILIRALAAGRAPTTTAPWASRPGSAHATIIGSDPMTTGSFTAWAQRSLLGTANPAIGEVLGWTLPHAVTELELPADARASHHARTAMRSIGAGLSCLD